MNRAMFLPHLPLPPWCSASPQTHSNGASQNKIFILLSSFSQVFVTETKSLTNKEQQNENSLRVATSPGG
jgi:hypothetical protein